MIVNFPRQNSCGIFFQQATSSTFSYRRCDRLASTAPECVYCHIKGHTKDKCYKLVGYRPYHPYNPNNKGK